MKLVVLVLLVATASAVAEDTQMSPDEANNYVALFDKIVDAVVANRNDCGTMAGDITAIVHVNQSAIRAVREAKAKGKKLPPAAAKRIVEGSKRMLGALDKCGRDDRVRTAFERINLSDRK